MGKMVTQLDAATRNMLFPAQRQALCTIINLANASTTACGQHTLGQSSGSLLRHIVLHVPIPFAIETRETMRHTGKSRLSLNDDL